jgi:hypothetical protein
VCVPRPCVLCGVCCSRVHLRSLVQLVLVVGLVCGVAIYMCLRSLPFMNTAPALLPAFFWEFFLVHPPAFGVVFLGWGFRKPPCRLLLAAYRLSLVAAGCGMRLEVLPHSTSNQAGVFETRQ